jgi:hypothetical protein
MRHVIISNERVPGARRGDQQTFTPVGYGLEVALPPGVQDGDSWELEIVPLTSEEPLGHTLLSGEILLSSPSELLSVLHGNLVISNNTDFGTFDFRGKSSATPNYRTSLITTYFNHVFLAIGRTLFWTDLDNYWNWNPAVDSEADFRIIEWEKEDITALVVLNDILYIHFPTCIYECVYTGKPTIVRILKKLTGSGAAFPRTALATKSAMFFMGLDSFYVWAPDVGLKDIGQEVWGLFNEAHSTPSETWAYHDIRNHEICWVNNNRIWAFNYQEGHWAKYSSNDAVAHTTAPWHVNFTPLSLATTGSSIERDRWEGIENLWITGCEVVREGRVGDVLSKLLPLEQPFLESDDLTYGDIHSYKTSDLVVLDAELKHPWVGVEVSVSGKRRVSDEAVYVLSGVWNLDKEHLDFVTVSGKALRYRFALKEDAILWDGKQLPNGGQRLDGKRLDLYNGTVKLDGSTSLHALGYEDTSTVPEYKAELYAWGERVNLPDVLIGPDK